MKILLCTDGSPTSFQSAQMVDKLRLPTDTLITVLGVSEGQDDLTRLNASMDLITQQLEKRHHLERLIRRGNPIEEIISEVLEKSYDLVALGAGGDSSGMFPPRLGSTSNKIARRLHTHFLVSRNVPASITKILVCAGPKSASNITMKLGGSWIAGTTAEVCLLHVLPEKGSSGYKQNQSEQEVKSPGNHAGAIVDPLLDHARQQLQNSGVMGEIVPNIRHGLVVDEVVKELSQQNYDLLVIGAHYQPGHDRWQETLWDDVTDQLLLRANCSVLII